MVNILLVRSRQELTPEARAQIEDAFPGKQLNLIEVEPRTPEELDEMTRQYDAKMVVLREQPLPQLVIQRGEVPVVPIRPGQPLQRIAAVKLELTEI